jgi:hypothetical protein
MSGLAPEFLDPIHRFLQTQDPMATPASILRFAMTHGFVPQNLSAELLDDLCAFADEHGVERLLDLLRSAKQELRPDSG